MQFLPLLRFDGFNLGKKKRTKKKKKKKKTNKKKKAKQTKPKEKKKNNKKKQKEKFPDTKKYEYLFFRRFQKAVPREGEGRGSPKREGGLDPCV